MVESTTTRKRGRPKGGRAFDHDEARRLHTSGMSHAAIAATLGCSPRSVSYACAKRKRGTIRLAGPTCNITDERWRELEQWIRRRHGQAGTYSRSQVSPRMVPRATR